MRTRVVILALVALAFLAGCAQDASTSSRSSTASGTATGTAARPARRHTRRHRRAPGRSAPARSAPRPVPSSPGLPASHASGDVVQSQPPAGSCHARGHGADALPDPRCTPGAVNPGVTQATIGRTICVSGWTRTVRPPESVTRQEKLASMDAYGDGGSPHAYEYDHLVSLELGGAVNDSRNLWPEPGGSPNPKDAVEDRLHRMVCDGEMPLAQARHIVATDWVAWAQGHPS